MSDAPHNGGAPTGQVKDSLTDAPDKTHLATLARRWRVLRLGCPRGCPLDHHEPPCHLAKRVA